MLLLFYSNIFILKTLHTPTEIKNLIRLGSHPLQAPEVSREFGDVRMFD